MLKTCLVCNQLKTSDSFYKGRNQCIDCYRNIKKDTYKNSKLDPNYVPRRNSPERNTHHSMKKRCNNPSDTAYKHYGGREEGRPIGYCERWESFANFVEDMGPRPDGYTLERKDVNGDYCKDNCEWIPAKNQSLNMRNTQRVVIEGETLIVSEAARKYGLSPSTVLNRHKQGMTGSELIANIRKSTVDKTDHYVFQGETVTIHDISKITGIIKGTLHYRIKVLGMTPEEAVSKPLDKRGSYKRDK